MKKTTMERYLCKYILCIIFKAINIHIFACGYDLFLLLSASNNEPVILPNANYGLPICLKRV